MDGLPRPQRKACSHRKQETRSTPKSQSPSRHLHKQTAQQKTYLTAPTIPHNSNLLRTTFLNLLHNLRNLLSRQRRKARSARSKKLRHLLLRAFSAREPRRIRDGAFHKVWHEDLEGFAVVAGAAGEKVGALKDLRREAEDVVD